MSIYACYLCEYMPHVCIPVEVRRELLIPEAGVSGSYSYELPSVGTELKSLGEQPVFESLDHLESLDHWTK